MADAGPILEQVLVDAPRAAVHGEQLTRGRIQQKAVLERAQVGLHLGGDRALGPLQGRGALGTLLIGLVDAAALSLLKADPLVVVAHETRDAALAQQQGDFVRRRPVADEIAETEHLGEAASLDVAEHRLESRQVAVHVGEDGEGSRQSDRLHALLPLLATPRALFHQHTLTIKVR